MVVEMAEAAETSGSGGFGRASTGRRPYDDRSMVVQRLIRREKVERGKGKEDLGILGLKWWSNLMGQVLGIYRLEGKE